ncbi:MAG: moaA [Holophagaceae bacterium]|nr:moaA [Holophagaceae bacterium]
MQQRLDAFLCLLRSIPGLQELALTTNGAFLEEQALLLREAGLDRVTVSLDSLQPTRFRQLIDAETPLEKVLRGIEAAPTAGFARGEGHILRFIEFMDAGSENDWSLGRAVPS